MSGYKSFAAGERLFAADVNDFLMEQAVMTFADDAARATALAGVLREGILTYNEDTAQLEVYDGTAFVPASAEPNLVAVKYAVKTDTQSNSLAARADVAITGMTINHAVADDSHDVLLFAQINGGQTALNRLGAGFKADGTFIAIGDSAANRTRTSSASGTDGGSMVNLTLVARFTPGVTTSVAYAPHVINVNNGTTTVFVNRTSADGDDNREARGASTFILMEVKV